MTIANIQMMVSDEPEQQITVPDKKSEKKPKAVLDIKAKINLNSRFGSRHVWGLLLCSIGGLTIVSDSQSTANIVLGALFCLLGLIPIFYINRLIITSKSVIHQRGVIIPVLNKSYLIENIKCIKLFKSLKRTRHGLNYTTYSINWDAKGRILKRNTNPWFAREVAEKLARSIKIPLDNQIHQVSSVRSPDELDMPLVSKWRKDGIIFDRPFLQQGTEFSEKRADTFFELSFPAEHYNIPIVLGLFLVFICFALIFAPIIVEQPELYFGFFGLSASLLLCCFLAYSGRSCLKIDPQRVSFRQGCLPIWRRIAIDEMEEFVVAEEGIRMIGDKKVLWIRWANYGDAADYVESVVKYELMRLASNI